MLHFTAQRRWWTSSVVRPASIVSWRCRHIAPAVIEDWRIVAPTIGPDKHRRAAPWRRLRSGRDKQCREEKLHCAAKAEALGWRSSLPYSLQQLTSSWEAAKKPNSLQKLKIRVLRAWPHLRHLAQSHFTEYLRFWPRWQTWTSQLPPTLLSWPHQRNDQRTRSSQRWDLWSLCGRPPKRLKRN